MTDEHGIGTYPVGLLSSLTSRRRTASLRRDWGYLTRQAGRRNWRAIRSYFNGYLAEWHYPPEGVVVYQCGRGWTRKAALRNLGRNIVAANLSEQEQSR